jgi:crotonobetainyl-CoA:carnitine CoA-transferase CaiB-like acyl-CoA transferase
LADALTDPQVVHRQMVLNLEGGGQKRASVAGNPIKFMGENEAPHRYPPALGQHSREVFTKILGLSEIEFEKHRANGIIFEAGDKKTK